MGTSSTAAGSLSEKQSVLNEERYRALVQSMCTFTWVSDPDGDFTTPQPGWEKYTGHKFEQHGRGGWIQAIHPEDRARVAEVWRRAVESKSWYEVEWRCWHDATQSWRRCVTRGVPILNPDGAVREWIGAVTDIENRLDLDQALQPEWLSMAQIAGGLALWDWTPATSEWHCTPELYRLYGLAPGSTVKSLDEAIHREDVQVVLDAREQASVIGHLDVTFRIIRPSGEIRWLRSKGSAVPKGAPLKLVGVLIDVTHRIELQESLRSQAEELKAIIDAVPAPVWITRDPECRFVEGNRAAHELFGAPPGSNFSKTPEPGAVVVSHEVLDRDGNPIEPSDLPLQKVCRTGIPVCNQELEFRFPNKARRLILITVYPLMGDGKVRGGIAVCMDITELKTSQRELARSNRELAAANEQLSHFNFVVSHDLREPLRQIAIFCELLGRNLAGTLDADSERHLEFTRNGVLRMEALLKDVREFAEISRTPAPVTKPASARLAFEDARRNCAKAIEESGAAVDAGELPEVMATAASLERIFQNLLSNALKYRCENPVIRVSASREGDCWRFAIEDNGIGIDPRYHDMIFEPFKRLHSHSEYEGTGVGLAICRKILEGRGGRIWVESELGKGSTFYFTLPAA